ncbi:hypothetical protein WJX72_008328 [[Myrmecia] bisecta]|uniref:Pentraxin (PTX) domain-containing protein n=1 Tax=[Myrmecia] bisecta TaxID=41462 RepID=A0AAW1PXR4_9CHLO
MSYALDSKAPDPAKSVADLNHFVVFEPGNVVACHDYQFIDLWPDPDHVSCFSAYNRTTTAKLVDPNGQWHHLAVTWTKANEGLTKIYQDGLLMAEARTGKSNPLQSGGAFMLGGEQDCYGGCTDSDQGFYGFMDEVRIWQTARTQEEILATMRSGSSLENHKDLVAYWQFNDPDEDGGLVKVHLVAKDSSGRGNDLPLIVPPERQDVTIDKDGKHFPTSALSFQNNYAMNSEMTGMPTRDVTVEFWARTPASFQGPGKIPTQDQAEFFSFATRLPEASAGRWAGGVTDSVFVDDAILIEKYNAEFKGTGALHDTQVSTQGSISVHINANRDGNGQRFDHWLDYAVGWMDDAWHHVAVTWWYQDGTTQLYFDGSEQTPFWRSNEGAVSDKDPSRGGVDRHLAARMARDDKGALVLGQDQDCYGGCFSPGKALNGQIANMRIWDRALSQTEVRDNMYTADPANKNGLVAAYSFKDVDVSRTGTLKHVNTTSGPATNRLYLWSDSPRWEVSGAPLADSDGSLPAPKHPLDASHAHAFFLNDQQVLMLPNFKDFPSTRLTVEFWMWSADACRQGVPFSYATGTEYGKNDNTFLIFNYQNWGVSVLEDEGTVDDHLSGVASTDGEWHHIAVTWNSGDGRVILYDNGRKVWSVIRGKGKSIPSGGTLVVGREQDCLGGCFDSARAAAGKTDQRREYGAQDFFGILGEMRIWKTIRTEDQIKEGMQTAMHRGADAAGRGDKISSDDPDLVAYWKFEEGQGYRVQDATGHGHHLIATQPPRWEVVRGMAVCGDGVLEGLEQCDDGNTQDGDGCSSSCKIEDGYECSGTQPSMCWRIGDPRPPDLPPAADPIKPPAAPDQPHQDDPHSMLKGGDSGDGSIHTQSSPAPAGDAPAAPSGGDGGGGGSTNSGSGNHVGLIISLTVAFAFIATLGVVMAKREAIYDNFPGIERGMFALRSRFRGRGAIPAYMGLDHLDPEENAELAPEFVGASHPVGAGRGTYQPMPDNKGPPPGV